MVKNKAGPPYAYTADILSQYTTQPRKLQGQLVFFSMKFL